VVEQAIELREIDIAFAVTLISIFSSLSFVDLLKLAVRNDDRVASGP
jgi:hypothetical protein